MDAARIAVLAPMKSELAPVVKAFSLHRVVGADHGLHEGRVGGVDIVATLTGIGMGPAKMATERALASGPIDHLMIVGIAGGISPDVGIGDMIWPEVVVDKHADTEHRPSPLPGVTPNGRLVCSDDFTVDAEEISQMIAAGVLAVDMETAAVAAVCDAAGCPWTAFRAISDRAGDPGMDQSVLALANQDGSPNVKNIAKFMLTKPWRIPMLAKLAKGSTVAATNAAYAARERCEQVVLRERDI
ncbi:MAG: 5'-methylthioadenosine/S-adenosylhomocysteine nucleosidase family protein [Actinomycetota bacterium]